MNKFEKLNNNLYRLEIPYKDIYTTVYLLDSGNGYILFDAAYTAEDFLKIREAVLALGVREEDISFIFISHHHRDHSWGLCGLNESFSNAILLARDKDLIDTYKNTRMIRFAEDGEILLGVYRVLPIVGHTHDSAALLDIRSATLISGDSLQAYGIIGSEDWAANIRFVNEYIDALKMLETLDISAIYTAHNFYPTGYSAVGNEKVRRFLEYCLEPIMNIKRLIDENPDSDNEEIRRIYNRSLDIPRVRENVIGAVRKAFCK